MASSGVQRGVHGLLPPRDGDTWIWCLACCSGFPVAGGSRSFLLQSQEQSAGAAALGELTAAGVQVFTPGECKGEIPELLVLPRASQGLRKQL